MFPVSIPVPKPKRPFAEERNAIQRATDIVAKSTGRMVALVTAAVIIAVTALLVSVVSVAKVRHA
jgi:hypothetical protein